MTIETIRHQQTGALVVVAKLMTGYLLIKAKIDDPEGYVKVNGLYDADFVAHACAWQRNHGLTPDGVIGPDTWRAIAKAAPTCSTSKRRISGQTMALQLLLDTNITCDAIYGSRTRDAVAVYQASKGLEADGVCGQKTWGALLAGQAAGGETAPAGTFVQPPDYKQYDSRWGGKQYSTHTSSQTMANSGCGPTAMADVVAALKDPNVTPYDLALLAVAWGDRSYNSGTNWSFFGHVMAEYGFAKMVQSASMDALKACLDAGGYVVCSMGPGYWTKGGHYICAWMYDESYIYANDPASGSRKRQKISDFARERKQFFCFYPDAEPAITERPDAPTAGYRGAKIVDISKWQPTVDYDALLGDAALVILRAGYRGTLGSVKIDECFKKHAEALTERGVRFGVYFYSIADTEGKAREEARAFFGYAGDCSPLFWAGDFEKESITTGAIAAFADELRTLLGAGAKLGAYVANHLYDHYRFDLIRSRFDFVWIPRYGQTRPKHKCDLWQYTSTGSVDGISGNVDLNRITGDGHDLNWFAAGGESDE